MSSRYINGWKINRLNSKYIENKYRRMSTGVFWGFVRFHFLSRIKMAESFCFWLANVRLLFNFLSENCQMFDFLAFFVYVLSLNKILHLDFHLNFLNTISVYAFTLYDIEKRTPIDLSIDIFLPVECWWLIKYHVANNLVWHYPFRKILKRRTKIVLFFKIDTVNDVTDLLKRSRKVSIWWVRFSLNSQCSFF